MCARRFIAITWSLTLASTVFAQAYSVPPKTPDRAPASAPGGPVESEGFVNGKAARFYGDGNAGVILTTAEAGRLGVRYRDRPPRMIVGMTTYPVKLDTVQTGRQTVRDVEALVVPDVERFFAVTLANPAKVQAETRRTTIEINGKTVQAYDFGIGGLMVPIEEANRIGLRYRDGRKSGEGTETIWFVEANVKLGGTSALMPVSVTDTQKLLERMQR